MSKEMQTNDIVLGKDYSSAKRWIAFFSIALIYFFYCFNFMVGTFVKPTMIYSPAEGRLRIYPSADRGNLCSHVLWYHSREPLFSGSIAARIGKKKTLILDCTFESH